MSNKLLNKFFILILASLAFIKIDATNIMRFRNLNTTQKKEVIDNTCSICCEEFKDLASQPNNNVEIIKLNCNHYFCKYCINEHIAHANTRDAIFGISEPKCPNCRAVIYNIGNCQEIHINAQESNEYLESELSDNSSTNSNEEILSSRSIDNLETRLRGLEIRFNHIEQNQPNFSPSTDQIQRTNNNNNFRQLNRTVYQINRNIRNLENNVNQNNNRLDNQINDIEQELNSNNQRIRNLNSNLEEANRDLRNLRNNIEQNIDSINDRLDNIESNNLILFNKTNSGMLGFLYAKLVNPNTIKSKKSRTILWSLPIFLMFIDNTKASHNNSSFISNLVSFSIGSWLGLNTNNNKDNNNNK